ALQSGDGKIVVAGAALSSAGLLTGFLVGRYNPDGSVDTGYGREGTTSTEFTGLRNETNPVKPLVLPDGTLVLAGTTSPLPGPDFGLAEYHPDGSLNSRFGTDGRVITDFGGRFNEVSGLALESIGDGPKIVVVGTMLPPVGPAPCDIGVARYNLDGSADTSFG